MVLQLHLEHLVQEPILRYLHWGEPVINTALMPGLIIFSFLKRVNPSILGILKSKVQYQAFPASPGLTRLGHLRLLPL